MSLFLCPVCRQRLLREESSYLCTAGHRYDIAAAGYVHLLLANQKHSPIPGDNLEMAAARHRFLSGGWYAPLKDALSEAALACLPDGGALLDSGCGEGYYTAGMARALSDAGRNPRVAGIDISKFSMRRAGNRSREIEFAVASAYHLPLADGSVVTLVFCFSPLALEVFQRVVRPGGYFLYVVPAPRHLWELKQAVYDTPYENEEKLTPYEGFSYCNVRRVEQTVTLPNSRTIRDLFGMTPYLWKTSADGIQRLNALETLTVQTAFDLHLFRRI